MNRSDDVLLADDPLIDRLRSLLPEAPGSLIDPDAPGNQAVLQSILDDHGDRGDRNDLGVTAGGAGRRRARLARWPRVAAVAAAVAGLVVVSTLGDTEQSAASLVRSAAAVSQEALASGRAAVTVTVDGVESTYDYQFAGDDVAVDIVLGTDDSATYPGARRIVDGEMYWRVGDATSGRWFRDNGGESLQSEWTGDPRTLLASLEPRAGFEIVGQDPGDGGPLTHMRATTPDAVDVSELRLGDATVQDGTPTAIDVWVDDQDVVRRIDIETTQEIEMGVAEGEGMPVEEQTITQAMKASVRFFDIGQPDRIEAPPGPRDLSVEDLAELPAP